MSELDLNALLDLLATPSADAVAVREEILKRATHLVDGVIEESFSQSGFSNEELFRPGYLGLLNAVYNVDFARGKAFADYAKNLIKGEIRLHIRERIKKRRFPRWLKDLNRQIEAAEARLLRETGRLPSLVELSEAVNITEEGIAELFKAREALNYVSLNVDQRQTDPLPTIDLTKICSKNPDAFPIQYRIRIASALEKLADLQQYLLKNLFPLS
ncbi:MAG TPA: sigma-70 domain-containing protein [Candidatus Heimdallarchaeota archaeon]|nr:sigma-70 domain-containing protein [Candidatus Heimdallarchaeota archaeon]